MPTSSSYGIEDRESTGVEQQREHHLDASPGGHRRKTAACHGVLDGYRMSHTTAAMSTSAARAAVTSPPSLVLRGSERRCRIPCRPRT